MNSARSLNRTHKDKGGVWQSYFDLRLFEQVENLVHQGRITCNQLVTVRDPKVSI
jgi:hypothetical protein